MNLSQNITQYITANNITLSNYNIQPNCKILTQEMFSKVLGLTKYSLLICSFSLVTLYFLSNALGWYQSYKLKRLKEEESINDIMKLTERIGMIQRIIRLICFVLSAWLLQIVIWGW